MNLSFVLNVLLLGTIVIVGITLFERSDHGIFSLAPSTHTTTLKSGVKTTIPFHAYQSNALIILGTANLNKMKDIMKGQDYQPVSTEDGKAVVVFWFMNYPNSTAGPYKELVYAIISSKDPMTVNWYQDPFQLAKLYLDSHIIFYVNKLWLTEQLPIDYGIEILGTDKYLMKVASDNWQDTVTFDWVLPNGSPLVKGSIVAKPNKVDELKGAFGLASAIGLQRTIKLLLSPLTYTLCSPKGINPNLERLNEGHNTRYHITGFGDVGASLFDKSIDTLHFGSDLSILEFNPELKLTSPNYDFIFYPPMVSVTSLNK